MFAITRPERLHSSNTQTMIAEHVALPNSGLGSNTDQIARLESAAAIARGISRQESNLGTSLQAIAGAVALSGAGLMTAAVLGLGAAAAQLTANSAQAKAEELEAQAEQLRTKSKAPAQSQSTKPPSKSPRAEGGLHGERMDFGGRESMHDPGGFDRASRTA